MTANPHPAIAPGNVAVITGGASGIGLAAARRFAQLGMIVRIADREPADPGAGISAIACDVSSREEVERLAATAAALGPVTVVMNNAGISAGGDVLASPEAWETLLGVNLMGVLHGVQSFVPAMIASDRPGLVINTGSKQGITQPPGNTAYNVSKSAVKSLTEGLAHTLREKTGNRVTAHLLIPGFTWTGMIRRHVAEKPAGAWMPEQVVDRMLTGIAAGEFYILCQDNETSREQDERRILWNTLDIIENRPALSRWHPDHKAAFEAFMLASSKRQSPD